MKTITTVKVIDVNGLEREREIERDSGVHRLWRRWCVLYGPDEYFPFELLYFEPCDDALLLPRSLLFLLY